MIGDLFRDAVFRSEELRGAGPCASTSRCSGARCRIHSGVRPHWRHGDAAARIGEANIPVRVRLGIALALTLILLPMHRNAYTVSMTSMAPLLVLMVHEIIIGVVLGATARVTLSALAAGSVIAQQLGLGFVTTIDPTQGQQGALIGNFLTMLG
jgi:hypothetical protein